MVIEELGLSEEFEHLWLRSLRVGLKCYLLRFHIWSLLLQLIRFEWVEALDLGTRLIFVLEGHFQEMVSDGELSCVSETYWGKGIVEIWIM